MTDNCPMCAGTGKTKAELFDDYMFEVFKLRYEKKWTWSKIAMHLGGIHFADAIRMQHNRHLKRLEDLAEKEPGSRAENSKAGYNRWHDMLRMMEKRSVP